MKKQYMKPSMKAIKVDPAEMICGSGDGVQTVSLGDPEDDGNAPESTTQSGFTGIFGE